MELVVFGGGRWSEEIFYEINKLFNIKRFFFITNNNNFLKKIRLTNKKVTIKKSIDLNDIKKNSKIIICNKAENHFKTLKKIKHLKNDILIEKPLFTKIKHIDILKNKRNIYFSNVFSFDKSLAQFSKKIINKKIIKGEIIWSDKRKEIRRGKKKKQNYNINFTLDIFSHLVSLLKIINNNRIDQITKCKIEKFNNDESFFKFQIKKVKYYIKINRKDKSRKRLIIMTEKKRKNIIDFSKDHILGSYNDANKIKKFSYRSSNNLSRILQSFIIKDNNLKKISIKNGIKSLKIYNKIFKSL